MTNKKTLLAALVLMASGTTAFAQDADNDCGKDYKPYPYMFIGLQGGAEATLTNYNPIKLVKPMGAVSFGAYFKPAIGARVHVSGYRNKGIFVNPDLYYKYNYVTSDLDLLINLTNLFSSKPCNLVNVVLVGGIGLTYAWDDQGVQTYTNLYPQTYKTPLAWKDDLLSHNLRVGVQVGFNLAKNWDVNLEVDANSLSDRFNSKTNNRDDWQITAMAGVAYKFGFKKREVPPAPVSVAVPEVWETRKDTVWYDETTYKTVPVQGEKIEKTIFFQLRGDQTNNKELNEMVDFVKTHTNMKISITGYADKGTGNAKLNMGYSKKRAEGVKQVLVDAGVDPAVITTTWKGDTVQPFAENDKNRVAITVATGDGTKQEPVITKKFRIEEKRVRVQ